jgi:quercetin dioxygenase-like cupin family protein/SAM-dependent methyltransferase
MNFGRKLENCRMCNSKSLYKFLDLGFSPTADGILNEEQMNEPEIFFPLKVAQCQDCGLTQLTYAVSPNILYNEKYSYESSITETGKRHFFQMADSICNRFNLKEGLVIDIGSNVGVLLEGFKKNGIEVLGIDPAPKIVKIANERGIETWEGLIGKDIAKLVVNKKGKAKIITATNVFAHIDDKDGFMESLKIMLDEEGVFIIEVPYLVDLIENLAYDTIYLDHLEYLSVKPLVHFFEKHGFEVFDVEKYDIHGKSIRVFIGKKGIRKVSGNVKKLLELEEEKGIYKKESLDEFTRKVKKHKKELLELLRDLKKQDKRIIGIGAPAKGNTILNYCKIDEDLIDYMIEKSKIKPDHYTPGMHIPIIKEEKLLEDNPDYGIIFPWNFAEEIIKNPINQEFIKRGGKNIIPIPKPVIIKENISNTAQDKTSEVEIGESGDLFGAEVKKIEPVFMDKRGVITDLLNEPIGHVGLIITEKDTIRANHYHKLSTQYSYILSGIFEVLLARSDDTKNVKKVFVKEGELIIIPPKVIHRFRAIERAVMVDMISESRDGRNYEDDVFRVKIEHDNARELPINEK